jgi:hypothetical protein
MCNQPNPLRRSTFNLLANPFSFSSLEPTHPSHNVRVYPSRCDLALCHCHGCPCTVHIPRVQCSICPLDVEIAADLFAIFSDSSEMVSRDKSLDIGNDLHLRQDQDNWNQDCKAYYGSQDCYMSDEDASGVPGATWACICPSYGGGDSSCSATYNNGYCYYDQYITIPGLPQGACACPVPPPNTSPPPQ